MFRETMTQPGVYWMLDAPFAQIIGLYSNIVEGPGEGAGGDQQQITWLISTLKTIVASRKSGGRKGLIIGVHHPSARAVTVAVRRCSSRLMMPAKPLESAMTR